MAAACSTSRSLRPPRFLARKAASTVQRAARASLATPDDVGHDSSTSKSKNLRGFFASRPHRTVFHVAHQSERLFLFAYHGNARAFSTASAGTTESGSSFQANRKSAARLRTYYDVLEIEDRQCDKATIKRQFRKLAKQYHPDKQNAEAGAAGAGAHVQNVNLEEKFREIREAYEILGNKWKRGLYDTDLRNAQAVATEVEEESWTRHWDNESLQDREKRRERYRRYARGDRNDCPPAVHNVPLWGALLGGSIISFSVWQMCVMTPEVDGFRAEETFSDSEMDMSRSSLVFAFYNPVEETWERVLDPHGREILPRVHFLQDRVAKPKGVSSAGKAINGRDQEEQIEPCSTAAASTSVAVESLSSPKPEENILPSAEPPFVTTASELSRMPSYVPPPKALYALYPKVKVQKAWPEVELPVVLLPRCRVRYWPRVRFQIFEDQADGRLGTPGPKCGWVRV
ncbi:unnamed protein product [Amoebophrya sp. A120]|nr:unnamed protein product [Amoebophrya sp. A120]|eukprot:GSA120T00025230001.1